MNAFPTLALAFGMMLTIVAAAPFAAADTPSFVRLRSINYAGSGCPAGSISANVSPDSRALSLTMDEFVAEVGPGVPLSAGRRNCQLSIDLSYPSGWSYAVLRTQRRGYVNLEPGVTATQTSSFYFQGQSRSARLSTSFTGPTSRDYIIADTLDSSAQVWSPCSSSRALNVNIQTMLRATMRNARGIITLEAPIDGTLGSLALQWRRC